VASWNRRPQNEPHREQEKSNDVSDRATPILSAWQSSDFRGYAVVQKRSERRLVVLTLMAQLNHDQVFADGRLIAADEVARDQWRDLLESDGVFPAGWAIETAEDLIGRDARLEDCIVVADELDSYLNEDLARAIRGVRGILGLCSSPKGLGGSTPSFESSSDQHSRSSSHRRASVFNSWR